STVLAPSPVRSRVCSAPRGRRSDGFRSHRTRPAVCLVLRCARDTTEMEMEEPPMTTTCIRTTTCRRSLAAVLLAGVAMAGLPAPAAEVTPQRLANPEPQNWLMNHRTYDGQRFSPLARISKDNVKNLKLAYAVPLGGGAGNEWIEATPLVEDGFLYITDAWGVLYKIDVRSGDVGRIVWRMEPKQE